MLIPYGAHKGKDSEDEIKRFPRVQEITPATQLLMSILRLVLVRYPWNLHGSDRSRDATLSVRVV